MTKTRKTGKEGGISQRVPIFTQKINNYSVLIYRIVAHE